MSNDNLMTILVLIWRKSINVWWRHAWKWFFCIFFPSDLDLWPLDLKLATLVTLIQRYVYNKLEVYTAFLFPGNWRHGTDGQTDRPGAALNAAPP